MIFIDQLEIIQIIKNSLMKNKNVETLEVRIFINSKGFSIFLKRFTASSIPFNLK